MKHIISVVIIFLIMMLTSGLAKAQVSALETAERQVNAFVALYNADVSEVSMYDSLYSAYQIYLSYSSSATPNERVLAGLRRIYPYMEDGCIFFSSNDNAIKALDYALAYIQIPQMDIFRNERFTRSEEYPRICYFAATTAYNSQRFSDAALCFRSYIDTNTKEKEKESYLYLAQSYKRLKKYDAQLRTIDEALTKYPDTPNYIYDAINSCLAMQNISGMEKYMDMALSLNPNDPKVLPIKAKSLGMKGDYASAYLIYERIYGMHRTDLNFCKDFATVAYNYAGILVNENNSLTDKTIIAQNKLKITQYLRRATELFERIIVAEPNEAKYMLALLDAYKIMGMEDAAKSVAAKIQMIGLTPNDNSGRQEVQTTDVASEDVVRELAQTQTDDNTDTHENITSTQVRNDSSNGGTLSITDVPSFSSFAKSRVEAAINKWQIKDDYETMAEYKDRVTEETRNHKIKEIAKEVEKEFIAKYSQVIKFDNFRLGKYDAENGVFLITSPSLGNMLLPVPRKNNEARNFEKSWKTVKIKDAGYGISDDKMVLTSLTFQTVDGKSYTYNNDSSLTYQKTHVDYNFETVNLASVIEQGPDNKDVVAQNIVIDSVVAGKSDIDIAIPINRSKNENLFAVIIANENYRREPSVKFATNDGEIMHQYCLKTLGCPNSNVRLIKDATYNDIIDAIDWIKLVANAYNGIARVIFYYAGHGIPNEASKTAFLMPVDGYATNTGTCYSLDKLYTTLGDLPLEQITVLLDACFSGSQRGDETLSANARGVEIEVQSSEPVGNMVVMSAASGSETAYPYEEQKHGLFTYYLLRKLKESKGKARFGEIAEYVKSNVLRKSILENRKSQTPSFAASPSVEEDWRKWKFSE